MGKTTGISWCDATFNPWIGCTKVSPGCANCYAETLNNLHKFTPGWGAGQPRKRTSANNWKQPLKWANEAVRSGTFKRIFCASLADVFDDEVPQEWRNDLWDLIDRTGDPESLEVSGSGVEWLILTKRPENISSMLRDWWLINPPPYVRIGVTCENQAMMKRYETLCDIWHGKNFISYEPAIGWISVPAYPSPDWLICGCESGAKARPMENIWVYRALKQCQQMGVPFFLKQMVIDGNLTKEPFLDGRQWLEFSKDGAQ